MRMNRVPKRVKRSSNSLNPGRLKVVAYSIRLYNVKKLKCGFVTLCRNIQPVKFSVNLSRSIAVFGWLSMYHCQLICEGNRYVHFRTLGIGYVTMHVHNGTPLEEYVTICNLLYTGMKCRMRANW